MDKKSKEPITKRPELKRDKKTKQIVGVLTMGDMIDDMTRDKDKKK